MPIYFRNTPVTMPFMFDSVGNHWYQESMQRPNGHPHYHYLQTEKGRGRIEIRGKHYILEEQEGILIAPSVPHSYGILFLPHLPAHSLPGSLRSFRISRLFLSVRSRDV